MYPFSNYSLTSRTASAYIRNLDLIRFKIYIFYAIKIISLKLSWNAKVMASNFINSRVSLSCVLSHLLISIGMSFIFSQGLIVRVAVVDGIPNLLQLVRLDPSPL